MEEFGINYKIPEGDVVIDQDQQTGRKKLMITSFIENSKIYYTVDCHLADSTANLYTGPTLLSSTNGRPLIVKYVIVTTFNVLSEELIVDVK